MNIQEQVESNWKIQGQFFIQNVIRFVGVYPSSRLKPLCLTRSFVRFLTAGSGSIQPIRATEDKWYLIRTT